MAGLQLLPCTRLKVACSLMAAERLDLQPRDWDGGACAVLVADENSPEGRVAIARALSQGTPVVRIGGDSGLALGRQATVREYVDVLRIVFPATASQAVADDGEPALPPLLAALRLDLPRKGRYLLQNGLLRVVADPDAGQLHFLRKMPLEALLAVATGTGWSVRDIDEAAWQGGLAAEVVATHPIETLWWRLAPDLPADLLGVEFQGMRLRAWPDLAPDTVAGAWMLPLACLQLREWRPQELAGATGLALKDVRRIMATARLAGLGERAGAAPGALLPGRGAAGPAISVLRLAKRFGMRLLGVVNG
ncbi:hypothetical protein [Arenimonas caeni]|uniref:hypothetical protein n=1 Tax=Arenimonas caeni TaxID=2058085 RepID=UPI002A37067E|nr:hypothetical protein [Arenimonas caeni]MDY0021355.1 hypothetical protein [Arenimonas caeni]